MRQNSDTPHTLRHLSHPQIPQDLTIWHTHISFFHSNTIHHHIIILTPRHHHTLHPFTKTLPSTPYTLTNFRFQNLMGDFSNFSFYVRYSALHHLPPLRSHCVRGCCDGTQDSCDYGIDCRRSNHSARSLPQKPARSHPLLGSILSTFRT